MTTHEDFLHIVPDDYFRDDYTNFRNVDIKINLPNSGDSRPGVNFQNKLGNEIREKEAINETKTYSKSGPQKVPEEPKLSFSTGGGKNVLNESISGIMSGIPSALTGFSSKFKSSLLKIKKEYDQTHTGDYTQTDVFNMHMLAFFEYMRTGPEIGYIGGFFILLSFFIYIINILIHK